MMQHKLKGRGGFGGDDRFWWRWLATFEPWLDENVLLQPTHLGHSSAVVITATADFCVNALIINFTGHGPTV